ncbi:unnamed protein product [Arabidopsis lyrata]|nr:unnamed protein product [Arabidopsis lyrata]
MKQFQSFQLSQRALAMDLQASLCFIAEIKGSPFGKTFSRGFKTAPTVIYATW